MFSRPTDVSTKTRRGVKGQKETSIPEVTFQHDPQTMTEKTTHWQSALWSNKNFYLLHEKYCDVNTPDRSADIFDVAFEVDIGGHTHILGTISLVKKSQASNVHVHVQLKRKM